MERYTVETVCSPVGPNGPHLMRLTYEREFLPERGLWREFKVAEEDLGPYTPVVWVPVPQVEPAPVYVGDMEHKVVREIANS